MLLVPKKQKKQKGNILKVFFFCYIKNQTFIRNYKNLVECYALDNCNTNRMEAV